MNAKENEASHAHESTSRPHDAPGMRPPATESLRRDLVMRLIARGPARLAGHLYRRMCVNRACLTPIATPPPLAWAELAQWARLEGLVTETAAQLLAAGPIVGEDKSRSKGAAPAPTAAGDPEPEPGGRTAP
jgi:hypothetical protein